MRERERELEQQHHVLKSSVESLRAEVLDLREELLRHADCDYEPIKNHIAKSIRAVMGGGTHHPVEDAEVPAE